MDQYRTSDLFLASYLFAKEHGIEGIDDGNKQRKEFIFNNTEQLQLDKSSYWDGSAKISPLKLFNAMKNLKNMIYNNV